VDFALTDEQRLISETVRRFVAQELMPHEAEVERLGGQSQSDRRRPLRRQHAGCARRRRP